MVGRLANAFGAIGLMAAFIAAPALAADPASSNSPATQVAAQGGGEIRALIGGDMAQPIAVAAVLRLGPADADWSDNGLPILLPIGRPHARYAGGGVMAGGASAGGDPLTCLTQAVYFESRGEPLEGQEGVAQVVMNRTHSARYPGSVCGVVFQRSGGGTCQFTFACDGSMDRLIQPTAWDRAKSVASQALGGFTYRPLELATHYHASWMTPYWSSSLTRIEQVGGQIFYH